MTQTPVSNLQASLTLTEFVDIDGVYPPRGGSGSGPFLGSVGIFAGEPLIFDAPAEGQLFGISQNTALFSILGTEFGGNGTNNFELPNLGGVETIGVAASDPLGQTRGQTNYDLTTAQLPPALGGSSAPIDKYQPSLAVNYVINTTGLYPSGDLTLNSLGVVSAFLGNFAPGGEMFCDGQLLPIAQYQALFALLGTTYGGNGTTNFALPDLQGRDIVGAGAGFVLGQTVGNAAISLSNADSPLVSDAPIDNQQPGLVLNYYIALTGIFPSQGTAANSSQQTPFLGQIVAFAGNLADPGGWALCDGQLLPINQNQALFSVLGTTYGGNGITNFALPDLQGRTVLGTGGSDGLGTLGQVISANTITLNTGNLPPGYTVPTPTLTVSSDDNATPGQQIGLTSLVTIYDPGSVGYSQLELWDSGGAGGTFQIGSATEPDNRTIDVSPANVSGGLFDASTQGGTDQLYARLEQNDGTLTAWQAFTVTVPTPTVTVSNDDSAAPGQQIGLTSLVTITDTAGVGYEQLQLWDSGGAGGTFQIGGATEPDNRTIDVSPANVGGGLFDASTQGGTDQLYARLEQNDGTLTAWQAFTVTVPTPTLTVSNDDSATPGQQIGLTSLVTITDTAGVGYEQLQLWDSGGAGGTFQIGGATEPDNRTIDVSPANVGGGLFDASTQGGTDQLYARLEQNDGTLTAWQAFTVTVPTPTVTVSSDGSAIAGQQIALSTLVTITDSADVGYQQLQLWDSDGTATGGEFLINGVTQTGNHTIGVPSGANVVFEAGTGSGTDTLYARLLQNNGSVSDWQQFSVTVAAPTLTVQDDPNATPSEQIALSTLVTVSDPSNATYQLQLWDSDGTPAGGEFLINGMAQSGNHTITVPSNANVMFQSGSTGDTDTLYARLLQSDGTVTDWQQFNVTDPVDIAAGASFDIPSAFVGPVTFEGSSGTLQLDHSQAFAGTIAGFGGNDQIDLRDIAFGANATIGYSANANDTGGTLTVSDGIYSATLALLGQYAASNFVAGSDGHGGTIVGEPAQNAASHMNSLAQPHHS